MRIFALLFSAFVPFLAAQDPQPLPASSPSRASYFVANTRDNKAGKPLIDDAEVQAFVETKAGRVLFTESGAFLDLPRAGAPQTVQKGSEGQHVVLKAGFSAHQAKTRHIVPKLRELAPTKLNFLLGPKEHWQKGVATYRKLGYDQVWDGISLELNAYTDRLTYRWRLTPGARPGDLRMETGAAKLSVNGAGDLTAALAGASLRFAKPHAYQVINGVRREVEVAYLPGEQGSFGFALGTYDSGKELVISPDLYWLTFLDGPGKLYSEFANSIARDAMGNIYVAGEADVDFPTTVGAYATHKGKSDVIVFKMNASGSSLLYATYLGGSDYEHFGSIQVNPQGEAIVAGTTSSTDFPTTPGAFDTQYSNLTSDAFVSKLNSDGSDLVFSTFLGAGGATDMALDSQMNAVVTGYAIDSGFPTSSGAYSTLFSGPREGFVACLNETGTALLYATFFGTHSSGLAKVSLDPQGCIYIAGSTNRSDLPTTPGAFQPVYQGEDDSFVVKLSATGSSLLYCTYVGGTGIDYPFDLEVDSEGKAYVTGSSQSDDFPTTPSAYGQTRVSSTMAFVYKLNADATALDYSTYISSGYEVRGHGIQVDANGSAYVVGKAVSTSFPTTPGAFMAAPPQLIDVGFALKLNADASDLIYSTVFGGTGGAEALCCLLDEEQNLIIAGMTSSSDFPVVEGAYQNDLKGNNDIFVLSLNSMGSALQFSTYIGGNNADEVSGAAEIQVDGEGHAYVLANAGDNGFPTTPGAYQTSARATDLVLAKLNTDATELIFATYIGGAASDHGDAFTLDDTGNAYIAGVTFSSDFPTTTGAFSSSLSGSSDCFVTKLNSDGSDLLFSTYLGGDHTETVADIEVDTEGQCAVLGNNLSTDFPVTSNAYDNTPSGGNMFLVKFNATGSDLIYGTFIGNVSLSAEALDLDETGAAYVLSHAIGSNAPTTPGAYDVTFNILADLFICKLDPTGSSMVFGTYLGGSSYDLGVGIESDATGAVMVFGKTKSSNFPTTAGAYDRTQNGLDDLLVCKLSSDGSSLLFSTLIGGSSGDVASGVAWDNSGATYFCGSSSSTDFPTTAHALDTTPGWNELIFGRLSPDGSQLTYGSYLGGTSYELGAGIALDAENIAYVLGYGLNTDLEGTPGVLLEVPTGGNDLLVAKIDFCHRRAAVFIDGQASVCPGATGVTYQIDPLDDATGYIWTVPDGASITAGLGTTAITVDFGQVAGDVSVRGEYPCGPGPVRSLSVALVQSPQLPGPIAGDALVCIDESGVAYSIDPVEGAASYLWSVPSGAQISQGQGSAAITVDFGQTAGEVSVQAINDCGDSPTQTLEVAFYAPIQIQSSFQDRTICPGERLEVTVVATGDQPDYQWYLDGQPLSDDDAISGSTSANLTIDPLDLSHQGSYTCEVGNPCGLETTQAFTLTVDGPLAVDVDPPAAVQGLAPLTFTASASCASGTVAYHWTNLETNDTYQGDQLTLSVDRNTVLELEASDPSGDSVMRQVLILYPPSGNLDLNGDGVNDGEDLLFILPQWQTANPLDLDGDGMVTILDFLYINTAP